MDNESNFNFADDLNFNQILTNPILDIAARFWEKERYDAFKVCYRSMRIVDDLVDDIKSKKGKISKIDKIRLRAQVKTWTKAINKDTSKNSTQKQLADVIKKFKIPVWPWEGFAKAMIFDIDNEGFETFETFLEYSEGAAIAPASISMHLCGVKKESNKYFSPKINIRDTARPLALFSYLVHIMRDFQKDQNNNLNFFAKDLMNKNNVTIMTLKNVAKNGKITPEFYNLMKKYQEYAENYRKESRKMIDEVGIYFDSRYKLSLEIIYSLYLQIFERVNTINGKFTEEEMNPKPEEVKKRIDLTISEFKSSEKYKKIF